MSFQKASIELANLLNSHEISWAYGGSCLLYFLGIQVLPRDLDVVIKLQDIEKAKTLLLENDAVLLEEKKGDNHFLTQKFYTFLWGNIEIDLMAVPGIRTNDVEYIIHFDEKGPWKSVVVSNEKIYLCDPEDWLQYYALMQNRKLRVDQLTNFVLNKCEN